MNIPSLGQLVGLIVSAIVVLNASGKGHLVWSAIYEMRQKAKTNIEKPWGCPSIFNRRACGEYDPRWYR
ncbi:MAG: hypothetical protein IT285_13725 [Bdellovibrionales bacterium]|nr:hypothetical protein [Bdellovibrionales bacterium]